MPANAPYPGETPEQFQLRMQQMAGGAAPPAQAAPAAMPRPFVNQPFTSPPMGAMSGGMAPPQAQASTGQLNPQDAAAMGALLGTYGDQLELGSMQQQLAEANALRDTLAPEGRNAGRVYVAANPLEHLATGVKRYQGSKEGARLKPLIEGQQDVVSGRVEDYGRMAVGAPALTEAERAARAEEKRKRRGK